MQYGIQSTKLSKLDLGWILSHTKWELKRWSQIDNVLSRYSSDTAATANSSITSRCQSLASDVESLGVDANKEDRCTFLAVQLRLMCTAAKGRRYSIDIIIYSFLFIFYKHLLAIKRYGIHYVCPVTNCYLILAQICILILEMYVKIILRVGQHN